eukprot:1444968-Amphidinium_carterae.1
MLNTRNGFGCTGKVWHMTASAGCRKTCCVFLLLGKLPTRNPRELPHTDQSGLLRGDKDQGRCNACRFGNPAIRAIAESVSFGKQILTLTLDGFCAEKESHNSSAIQHSLVQKTDTCVPCLCALPAKTLLSCSPAEC